MELNHLLSITNISTRQKLKQYISTTPINHITPLNSSHQQKVPTPNRIRNKVETRTLKIVVCKQFLKCPVQYRIPQLSDSGRANYRIKSTEGAGPARLRLDNGPDMENIFPFNFFVAVITCYVSFRTFDKHSCECMLIYCVLQFYF